MTEALRLKIEALLESITKDMVVHGDLLTRETIRCADEVRLEMSRSKPVEEKP
jgi:hypothetical protein